MTFVELRFEPKNSPGDKELVRRAKKALVEEFGEMWELTILNID